MRCIFFSLWSISPPFSFHPLLGGGCRDSVRVEGWVWIYALFKKKKCCMFFLMLYNQNLQKKNNKQQSKGSKYQCGKGVRVTWAAKCLGLWLSPSPSAFSSSSGSSSPGGGVALKIGNTTCRIGAKSFCFNTALKMRKQLRRIMRYFHRVWFKKKKKKESS